MPAAGTAPSTRSTCRSSPCSATSPPPRSRTPAWSRTWCSSAASRRTCGLRRQPHVLLEAALEHQVLDQAGVLDLGGGDVAEHGEDLQVLLVEGAVPAAGIEVHQPAYLHGHGRLGLDPERGADGRADGAAHHAVERG